jgi:trehalose utilization protein
MPIKVVFWNEYRHEKSHQAVREMYPQGLHAPVVAHLQAQGFEASAATLDEPEHGLPAERLAQTDVLLWWGHMAHGEVQDEVVERVRQRVLEGMGLIVLHSGHFSKIFRALMGTTCNLKWRVAGEKERLWVISPGHPIAEGIDNFFEIEHEEMYGEYFDIPQPDETVFVSWFAGGNVFRSGVCYQRARGRVFYFRPGHETYPTYYQPQVLQVITNAVRWAAPQVGASYQFGQNPVALEKI